MFNTDDNIPPSPLRTPTATTRFPRFTSLARQLLSDEGWDLPFHLRVAHVGTSPLHKADLLLRRRGKDSGRLEFSVVTPTRSAFSFGLSGLSRMNGELFWPSLPDSNAAPDTEAPLAAVEDADGHGMRWSMEPSYGLVNMFASESFVDYFWRGSHHIGKNNYLRGGFVVGGMLPASFVPFRVEGGGISAGATVQIVKGPWAVGVDCQARSMWLDLTGGKLLLNTVLAYQKPAVSLTLNIHGFGERFIASAVANPCRLAQWALRPRSGATAAADLYACRWLVGAEADVFQDRLLPGAFQLRRMSFALARRNAPFPAVRATTTLEEEEEEEEEVYKAYDELLSGGETKLRLDVLDQGLGAHVYRVSAHVSALVRVHRDLRVRLSASVQADAALPLAASNARAGLNLAFVI